MTNDLVNGGFEADCQGWSVSGNVGIRATAPYAPSAGLRLVAFNAGNTLPNGILSQTFVTTPGITYPLSFDMGVLAYNTSEQRLRVELGGSPAFLSETHAMRGLGGGKILWETRNLTFTADGMVTTLTFRDLSTANDSIDLLLDNIRLEWPPTGFPAGRLMINSTLSFHEVFSCGIGRSCWNRGHEHAACRITIPIFTINQLRPMPHNTSSEPLAALCPSSRISPVSSTLAVTATLPRFTAICSA